jgi:hypothetical protein
MHMRRPHSAAVCLLALCVAGCAPYRAAFVESGHSTVGVSDLQKPPEPLPVRVRVQFLANGEHKPNADGLVMKDVDDALAASGVLVRVQGDTGIGVLEVTVDDRYDNSSSTAHGFINGLTFGEVTRTTRDDYVVTLNFRNTAGLTRAGHYTHAIITEAGKGPPPDRGRAMTPEQAFSVVISQSLLAFLGDLQAVDGNEQSILFMRAHPQ